MNWGQVHVGDTVRGADQRVWVVCERQAGPRWVLAGESARFVLRLGDRTVEVMRRAGEPVEPVAVADHRAAHAAADALLRGGLSVGLVSEVLNETEKDDMPPRKRKADAVAASLEKAADQAGVTADQFAAPAPRQQTATTPGEPRRDRWGRYLLPDPITGAERAWTRVSTVARTLADEYHLTMWKLRMTAKGVALRPDLIAGAAAADPESDKSTLDSIAKQAMERAGATAGANMGTAFHTFAQRLDGGEPLAALGAPSPIDADLAAYAATLKAARLNVIGAYMERIVVLPELGVAGTLDRLVAYTGGKPDIKLQVMDLKSGKTVDFGWLEYAVQQALYARATHMWDAASGGYSPMPHPLNQDRALIAHVPIGKASAQLYGVDLIKGWRAAQVAMDVRAMRTECGNGLWSWLIEPDDQAAVALHNVSRAADQTELAALWDRYHPKGLWTTEVNAAAAARWEQLKAQPVNA